MTGLISSAMSIIVIRCFTFAPAMNSIVKRIGIINKAVPKSGSARIRTIGRSVRTKGPSRVLMVL
jgi:hypothetical protein